MKRDHSDESMVEKKSTVIKNSSKMSWIAFVLSVLAAFLSACGNLFLKITEENKMKVVLIRNGMQFLILLPVLTWRKTDLVVMDLKVMLLALLRGIMGPSVLIFVGFSMNYLSLGDAMAIFYTYPVFVGFFACLCLNEKCGVLNIILTITTMGGFVLVAQPSFIFGGLENSASTHNDGSRMFGALLAVLGAIVSGLVAIILRKIGTDLHFSQTMLYVGMEGAMLSVVSIAVSGIGFLPCFKSLPTILGCSVCFFFGQICRTVALQLEKAGPVTLIQTSQIIFSFLLQYIFLNEIPNLLCIIGSSLILLSCVALGVKNILKTVKTNK